MGSTQSLQFLTQHFPPNQYHWKELNDIRQQNDLLGSNSKCKVIDDKIFAIGEKYTIREYDSLQYQLQALLFRKQNSSCLVTVKDVKILQNINLPSSIVPDCMLFGAHNKPFLIILQPIPYRLSDIGILRFQQMVYVLEQCFKALQLLWVQFGRAFYIDDDLVCFNDQGQCKLWVNQSLQKNKPNIDANFLPRSIIQQVFQMLENRVDQFTITESYYRLKSKYQFQKFTNAIKFIQKVKKHQGIKIYCIKSLRKQPSKSDSFKALSNKQKIRGQSSDQKKVMKFSLKQSKKYINLIQLSKIDHRTPKTAVSKQQQTQVSIRQIQRMNYEQNWVNELMCDTYKSDRLRQKNTGMLYYTQYSQKKKKNVTKYIDSSVNKRLFYQISSENNRYRNSQL